ncbi:MAG: hypothetical protein EAZ97_12290 [Bacteroidetes bacterium]|nr:MAG: hypothetical protein EAZ97_12290 [Bacteroidota bacterium]
MEITLNHYKIAEYAQKFAKQICDSFFSNKTVINGKQILEITSSKQVNWFVLKTLFLKWQTEMARLKSPYFDYSSAEVSKAMTALMNILSRQISVKRQDFEVLLSDAVEDALLLALSPYDFFVKIFEPLLLVNIDKNLVEIAKYVKYRSIFFEKVIENLKLEAKAELSITDALISIKLLTSRENFADAENILQELKNILAFDFSSFFLADELEKAIEPLKIEDEKIEDLIFEPLAQNLNVLAENPLEIQEESRSSGSENVPKTPQNQEVTPAKIETNVVLAETETLRQSIPLNKKFSFINDLFGGNGTEYNEAVDLIDQCNDYHKAIMLIKERYFRKYAWDLEKNSVKEFYELVSRKF